MRTVYPAQLEQMPVISISEKPMPGPSSIRVIVAAVTTIAIGLATAGVTYAATSSSAPSAVTACVSSNGVLSLLSAKGKCTRAARKVIINKDGPTGATGRRGKQGPQGDPGIAAPRPLSIALDNSTDSVVNSHSLAIGSTGMTLLGLCSPGGIYSTQLALRSQLDYYVHGAAQYVDSGSNDVAQTDLSTTTQSIPSGASLIAYEAAGSSMIELYSPPSGGASDENAQLYADLVVLTDGQSFSVHLYEFISANRCQLSAQVIAP